MKYYKEDQDLVRSMFDLESLIAFQSQHCVEVVRHDDYSYYCYIDNVIYGSGLTMLSALVVAQKRYENEITD
jgi:hypothetical protein